MPILNRAKRIAEYVIELEQGISSHFNQWTAYFLLKGMGMFIQSNLPIADIRNSGHAMNSGQNVKSQMWQSFLNYLPIADTSQ